MESSNMDPVVARLPALWVLLLVGCGRFGFGSDDVVDDANAPVPDALVSGDARGRYEAAVLADHPVGFWRFEPARQLADASATHADGIGSGGIMLGGASLLPSGGTSAGFDGSTGYIGVGSPPAFDFTSSLTLEGWIDATSFDHPLAGGYPRVVHKGPTGNTGFALMVEVPTGMNIGYVRIELEGVGAGLSGATTLIPGRVYHVAATYDGTFMRVFTDGQVDGVAAASGPVVTNTEPLEIGRRRDDLRYWHGQLDEIAVYPAALTPQQIADHFAAAQ